MELLKDMIRGSIGRTLRAAILLCLFAFCRTAAFAQDAGGTQVTELANMWEEGTYYNLTKKDYTVKTLGTDPEHRTHWNKWRDLVLKETGGEKPADRFKEGVEEYPLKDKMDTHMESMSPTHIYVDTLYVKKGTKVRLELPTLLDQASSASGYVRWYSYRSGSTFTFTADGKEYELLKPEKVPESDYLKYFKTKGGYIRSWHNELGGPNINGNPRTSSNMYCAEFYYPTTEEYDKYLKNKVDPNLSDIWGNDYYAVVCDVSLYGKEVLVDNEKKVITEPTLSLRCIFHISGCYDSEEEYNDTEGHNYQNSPYWSFMHKNKGKSGNDDLWYKDYEINFPYKRTYYRAGHINAANNENYFELVALSKEADYMFVPGGEQNAELNVTLEDHGSGISLAQESLVTKKTLKGNDPVSRIIKFYYPKDNVGKDPESVDYECQWVNADNSYAYIYVRDKNNLYNLARYKLIFKKGGRLLSQSDIDYLDAAPEDIPENKKKYVEGLREYAEFRPKFLREKYGEPVARISFNDFPKVFKSLSDSVVYVKNETSDVLSNSPFDEEWGIRPPEGQGSDFLGRMKYYPFPLTYENSSYGFYDGTKTDKITCDPGNDKPAWGHYALVSTYMYDEAFASPTKPTGTSYSLFVDASAVPGKLAVLTFNTQLCSGAKLYLSAWVKNGKAGGAGDIVAADAAILCTLMGERKNEKGETVREAVHRVSSGQIPSTTFMNRYDGKDYWLRFYSEFTVNPEVHYDRYVLELSNNASSTSGGDYYLHEVNVYLSQISVEAQQLSPACSDAESKVRLLVDYDKMLARVGMEEKVSDEQELINDNLSFAIVDKQKWEAAGKPSLVPKDCQVEFRLYNQPGTGLPVTTNPLKSAVLSFSNQADRMDAYDNGLNGQVNGNYPTAALLEKSMGTWRMFEKDGTRYLAIDISGELSGGQRYYMAMRNGVDTEFYLGDVCDISYEVPITSNSVIRVDGEIAGDEQKFCAGQVSKFTADLYAYKDGERVQLDDASFDWFVGSMTDFTENNVEGMDFTYRSALSILRDWYPEVTSLQNVVPRKALDRTELTQAHIDALEKAVISGKLCLRNKVLSLRLQEDNHVIAVPIPYEKEGYLFCWDPTELHLVANEATPGVSLGYEGVEYPDYTPCLRMGLKHLQTRDVKIKVPLRDVTVVSKGGEDNPNNCLKLIKGQTNVFIVGTDDPRISLSVGSQDDMIGDVEGLWANDKDKLPDFKGDSNYLLMSLYPEDDTDPTHFHCRFREGFTYDLVVWCTEAVRAKGDDAETEVDPAELGNSTTCYANIVMRVKVVPEFAVWQGEKNGSWDNDLNWRRANTVDIKETAANYTDYPDDLGRNFIPMDFTNIVIPESRGVELKEAVNKKSNVLDLGDNDVRTGLNKDMATPYVEYDLMGEMNPEGTEVDFVTYYTNKVRNVHFEAQSEMAHTERLRYERAWVDFRLSANRWTLLSSPLHQLYAGDFYTPKADMAQETPYFTEMEYDENLHDRFAPAVFQRNWDRAKAQRFNKDESYVEMNFVEGQWSGLYNKVTEQYGLGRSFSFKPVNVGNRASVSFRLPKEDTGYRYYEAGKPADGTLIDSYSEVQKDEAGFHGRVFGTDDLDAAKELHVSLPRHHEDTDGDSYYFVGNPFMASLDLNKFFDKNPGLERKAWIQTDDRQNVVVGNENGWTENIESTNALRLPPLRGFFVKKAGTDVPADVVYTADMQCLSGDADNWYRSNAFGGNVIRLSANDGRTVAAIVWDEKAESGYLSREDAELLSDGITQEPLIYTVAGNRAASINRMPECNRVAIGLTASGDPSAIFTHTMRTVRFDGLDASTDWALVDLKTQTTTPLADGDEVELEEGGHGRYFLVHGGTSSAVASLTAYSLPGGRLVVASSEASLKSVWVYTPDGRRCALPAPSVGSRTYQATLTPGIYLVSATSETGETLTVKLKLY